MSRYNQQKHKLRIEVELHGEEALAFYRAFEMSQIPVAVCGGRKKRFAEWMLARASEAYAVASMPDRCSYWIFDLRPRTAEESKVYHVLEAAEKSRVLEAGRIDHGSI